MLEKMFESLWFAWCSRQEIEAHKTETAITIHIWTLGSKVELILFSDGTWRLN